MSPDSRNDEFFIGWLKTPAGYVRFLRPLMAALVIVALATGAALAWLQSSPGDGQWDDDKVVTLRGIALTNPYAVLRVNEPGKTPRTYLLVEDGKFGALPRTSQFVKGRLAGVPVEVKGTILHRGDRWMIALEPGTSGMRALSSDEVDRLRKTEADDRVVVSASTKLRGEIIDPKCYLGAMKPGRGKTHKACAMRCIAGGIPPMLVTRDADGETFYLLVAEDGSVANDLVYPFVGDRVEATGRVERDGDLHVLRIRHDSIHR